MKINMKNFIKSFSSLILLLFLLILPYLVFAESPKEALEQVGPQAGFAEANETTVSEIAGTAVNTILGLLGVIFVILTIYGGGRWMTAQGNEEEVQAAQKIIKNSIIGLIIIVSAYAIYNLFSVLIIKYLT